MDHQHLAFDDIYRLEDDPWTCHYTKDPLTRYLRDRRLRIALNRLDTLGQLSPGSQTVLIVCGGVGGEGTFLRKFGFAEVTVSDFSAEALSRCRELDPELKTLLLDAERADLPDDSYDIVLVQDGLHHLPRPALGYAEMLRITRTAAVLIEPHVSLVGRLIGTEWEVHGDAINYVFRWNAFLLEQCTRSFLLSREAVVVPMRLWDHNLAVMRIVNRLPVALRLPAAHLIYWLLKPLDRFGNMMIGVVIKAAPSGARLVSH